MKAEIKQRLARIKVYDQTGDAGLTSRKCGISRPTLRLWWRRSQEHGVEGLTNLPIKPRSPHLNGKMERPEKTDWEEFYSCVDLSSPDLTQQREAWQDYYNQQRPDGSLHGKTPWERWVELLRQTPYRDEVEAMYDVSQERIQH